VAAASDSPAPPRPARQRAFLALVAGAAVAVGALLALLLGGDGDPPEAAEATTAAAPSSTTPPAVPTEPTPSVPAVDPAATADLERVAATLDTPRLLSSPAAWDRWLPEGKPYPGASTEEDIATCPRLSDRLGAALGAEMSYWTGTLPMGPYGCTWATVPLSYDGPYTYPYLAGVGFVADGTTTEELRTGFYQEGGAICPGVDVPDAGPGAVLVRCEQPDSVEYVLAVEDQRIDGVWVLSGTSRTGAAYPAELVLASVVDGVQAAHG
jgi:hypothetical protein